MTTAKRNRPDLTAPTKPSRLAEPESSGLTATLSPTTTPGVLLSTADPVRIVRLWGIDTEHVLDSDQRRFTLGVRGCDLLIPKTLSPKVSSFHALLERRGPDLWVEDQGSKNGTFPIHAPEGVRGAAKRTGFLVAPGGSFAVADVRLLVLDAGQWGLLRPTVARCVGLVRYAAIDEAIFQIAAGGPLALLGPTGLDQRALALAIHQTSSHRLNPFIQVTEQTQVGELRQATAATVFLDLTQRSKTSREFRDALIDPRLGLHLVVAAPTVKEIGKHLGEAFARMTGINLLPLGERRTEVEALIADDWRARGSTRNVLELGEPLGGLRNYPWPKNLDELRTVSERLLAWLEHGGQSGAARVLGISRQAIGDQFDRVGFRVRS